MELSPSQAVVSSPTFIDSPLSYLSRDRRGLLPLKKRRLHVGGAEGGGPHCSDKDNANNVVESSPSAQLEFQQAASTSGDVKLAALELMSAPSAPFDTSSATSLAHIVSSSSTTLDTCATTTSDESMSSASCLAVPGSAGATPIAGTPVGGCSTARAFNQQDRRFTANDPPDIRCQATTTRGRPCAFVSVVDTKYCHLHATYETNPPPRRSGYTEMSVAATSPGSRSHDVGNGTYSRDLTAKISKSRKANPTKRTDFISGDDDIQLPLLNSTPSGQWLNKLVQVATGPFKGEHATVLTWGNGWVTVRLLNDREVSGESTPSRRKSKDKDKGVLHNRRAVELYLLPVETKQERDGQVASSSGESSGQMFPKDDEAE